jgi:uncharacterized membrane protein
MYLSWIDYGILILVLSNEVVLMKIIVNSLFLVFSGAIGIYQGCIKSKQTSTKEFLVADGRMKVI